jgi:hypothetical protein
MLQMLRARFLAEDKLLRGKELGQTNSILSNVASMLNTVGSC